MILKELLKKTGVPKEFLNELHFSYTKNMINIKNYGRLNDIEKDIISCSDILVFGNNLKIFKMNNFEIIIKGEISKVEVLNVPVKNEEKPIS